MMDENDKHALIHLVQQKELEEKINNIQIDDKLETTIKNYEKINNKLNDTFFTLKKKDKDKLEKEKRQIEENPDFKNILTNYRLKKDYEKELNNINIQIWNCNYSLQYDMSLLLKVLKEENYIETIQETKENNNQYEINGENIFNKKIMKKGIIAMGINECNEILFTEMIMRGILDDLEFPEIIALLSSLINEKDQNNEDKFINQLYIPKIVKERLNKMVEISEYFLNLESKYQININSDYKIYLDFIEPSYIWANGGTINEVYQHTTIYDGNFVKAIMRINNICENLNDICKNIERYDICTKLEGFTEKLIRDVTSINSLYVN
jgi:superfamily II RNA helicase